MSDLKEKLVFIVDVMGGGGGGDTHRPTFAPVCCSKWCIKILSSQGRNFLKLRVYKVRILQFFFSSWVRRKKLLLLLLVVSRIGNVWFSWLRIRVFLRWGMVGMKRMCEHSLTLRKCTYHSWRSLHGYIIGVWCTGNRRARVFQTENNSYAKLGCLKPHSSQH